MLKKKEKLEQMRELGRGGLSKGLSFLRTAAASAAIEAGDASASTSTSSTDDGGGAAARLSYEELVALSMKLTRQNKLMKAQFQKTQARLAAAAASDADVALLRAFVERDVGVDLAACARPPAHESEGEGEGEAKTAGSLDGDALRERYHILRALREKERAEQPPSAEERVDVLSLSPAASTSPAEESELSAAAADAQLDEAARQVERMREQLRLGAEQTRELERTLAQRDAQQREACAALESDKQELERSLARLQGEQQEAQRAWQAKWDEQSARLADKQQDDAEQRHTEAEAVAAAERKAKELEQQLEAGAAQHEAQQLQATRALEALQQDKAALAERLADAQAQLQAGDEAHADAQAATASSEAQEAQEAQETLEQALATRSAELRRVLTANEELQDELRAIRAAAVEDKPTPHAEAALAALRDEVARLQHALQAREAETQRLEDATQTQTQELRALQETQREAEQRAAKAQEQREANDALVAALKQDTSRLADQVALLETQRASGEQEREALAQARQELTRQLEAAAETREALETQLQEERAYWASKLETLVTDGDAASSQVAALRTELADKEAQVSRLASAQKSLTAETMELQVQLGGMRKDLAMAAEALEAHASKAEASERRCSELQREADELKTQVDTLRSELAAAAEDKAALQRECEESRTLVDAGRRELETARTREQELEAALSEQSTRVGHLGVDLAETKKALSDRMALATRLQTDNMALAGKQAEQVALLESALRDAAAAQQAQQRLETQAQTAQDDVARVRQDEARARRALEDAQRETREQAESFQAEREEAQRRLDEAVQTEKTRLDRELERVEAESKHKSKLALQAVLEKEAEIARLRARLCDVEEDVRSGGADNRKILELAQLQAKREAEARAQAAAMQELTTQLEDARREVLELREARRQHAEELTAMLQSQRRDGVNMEYLKNVVVQYMSFRPGSSQQARLVPVLATLLQFAPADMQEIKRAASGRRGGSWTSWGTSDSNEGYKPIVVGAGQRHPMAPPVSASASGASKPQDSDAAGRRSFPHDAAASEAPSPLTTRASSFFLPNGSHDEGAHPSAESADF